MSEEPKIYVSTTRQARRAKDNRIKPHHLNKQEIQALIAEKRGKALDAQGGQ